LATAEAKQVLEIEDEEFKSLRKPCKWFAKRVSAFTTKARRNMRETFINLTRIAWLIGIAVVVMIVNVALSVLYMVVYSYVIDPGHEAGYYDAHIQIAAPYCSIVAGIPLMFLAGWWVGRWWRGQFAFKSALIIWFVYAVIDVAIMLGAGLTSKMAIFVAVSVLTKVAAVYAGALFANSSRTA
jgi:hypothetical protein